MLSLRTGGYELRVSVHCTCCIISFCIKIVGICATLFKGNKDIRVLEHSLNCDLGVHVFVLSACIWTFVNICPCRHLGGNSEGTDTLKLRHIGNWEAVWYGGCENFCALLAMAVNIGMHAYGQGTEAEIKLNTVIFNQIALFVPHLICCWIDTVQEMLYSYGTQVVIPKSPQFLRNIIFTWCFLMTFSCAELKIGCQGVWRWNWNTVIVPLHHSRSN